MGKYTLEEMVDAALEAAECIGRAERPTRPLVMAQAVAQAVGGNVVADDDKIKVYVDGRDIAGKDARGCFEVTDDCKLVGRFYTSVSRDRQHPNWIKKRREEINRIMLGAVPEWLV